MRSTFEIIFVTVFVLIAIGLLLTICAVVSTVFSGCSWVNEAGQVAYQEARPATLLKKYMWFKDASAMLDKKIADIGVYEARFKELKDAYGNKPRSDWSRDDREQYNIWASELAGIKASYNSLAAEYNAAMSKINWAFCNVGSLPPGADKPLPREYKPYIGG